MSSSDCEPKVSTSSASAAPSNGASPANSGDRLRQTEVRYLHSSNLADLLTQLRVSLVISTYQAGKLVVVGIHEGKMAF